MNDGEEYQFLVHKTILRGGRNMLQKRHSHLISETSHRHYSLKPHHPTPLNKKRESRNPLARLTSIRESYQSEHDCDLDLVSSWVIASGISHKKEIDLGRNGICIKSNTHCRNSCRMGEVSWSNSSDCHYTFSKLPITTLEDTVSSRGREALSYFRHPAHQKAKSLCKQP